MDTQELVQEISSNPSLDNQDDGPQAAPQQPAASPAETPEPSALDKLRQKGTVAPPAVGAKTSAATEAAIEAYKANLKFKAAGKEHDVPELLRGVMKDSDSEKFIHSVLSKAHGLEMVQGKLRETREARDQIHQAYSQVMEPIQYAREAYQQGDLDTVFDTLKMDPNKVLQWAYQKVQLSQMPPDQRQVHEARTQAERQARDFQRQNASLVQQNQAVLSEQINQMLEIVLERPDYSAVAQAYDTRKGKQGAFRDLVAQMGEQEYVRSNGKVILSPVEAAKAAVELLGEKLQAPVQQSPAAAPQQVATPAATEKPKITLPNAAGAKAASPAKGPVKSIDDIRKLHQKMASAR